MSFAKDIKTSESKYNGVLHLGGQTNRASSRALLFFFLAAYSKIQGSPQDEQAAAKCSPSINNPLLYQPPTLRCLDPETVGAKPEDDH